MKTYSVELTMMDLCCIQSAIGSIVVMADMDVHSTSGKQLSETWDKIAKAIPSREDDPEGFAAWKNKAEKQLAEAVANMATDKTESADESHTCPRCGDSQTDRDAKAKASKDN